MNSLQTSLQQELFDKIFELRPRSVEEYNGHFCAMMAELSPLYGIGRVESRFIAPSEMLFTSMVSPQTVLFQSGTKTDAEAVIFSYPLESTGKLDFYIFLEEGKVLRPDNRRELDNILRCFYYIFDSLILRLSYKKLLMTDYNTSIPNLKAFFQVCDNLIARGKIGEYTALYFNVRNFKSVHKTLTYLEGNAVMEQYCQIVSNAVTTDEIVARFGGDNFVALILDKNKDYFLDLVQNVIIKFKKGNQTLRFLFGASVGAAKLTAEGTTGEIMMHISMAYQTARESKSLLSYYTQEESQKILERQAILSNFTRALKMGEFYVLYQPKVELKTRTLLGAEALVRWNSNEGYSMPSSFIPVLEKDGSITMLDFFVLDEVCGFLKKMLDAGIEPVKISVNFSKRHLANNKLVEEIVNVIDRHEVPRNYIKIELTESEDYHDNGVMKEVIEELNMQGVKTAIDDFGTGYSSLAMLNTLPLDELKIDRSFIPRDQFEDSAKSLLMLKGVVNLAKSLGLTIVAEGVETPIQLKLIESMDCDMVQGYIFDRPLREDDFVNRLKHKSYTLDSDNPID